MGVGKDGVFFLSHIISTFLSPLPDAVVTGPGLQLGLKIGMIPKQKVQLCF